MPFYPIDIKTASSFDPGSQPRLMIVGQDDGSLMRLPRVMHKHDNCLEILLIRRGAGRHVIDGKVYDTQAGDLLIYNAGSLHDESASLEAGISAYYCAATDIRFPGLDANHLMARTRPAVIPSGDAFTAIDSLFAVMCQTASEQRGAAGASQISSQQSSRAEACHYLLRALLVIIHSLMTDEAPIIQTLDSELSQKIKEYLDQHYQEDLTLSDIADQFHINPYYLAHLFKEIAGYSPMQYLIRRRIGEAQSLLQNSDWTVSRIATHVGYNNINHFHSAFVKLVGMAPGQYRKNWKKS